MSTMSSNNQPPVKHGRLQLELFFIALGFFSRIPMPKWVEIDADKLNKASRYFGLAGLVIGAFAAAVFWVTQLYLPPSIAVIISMISSVLVTGAFHEDGLADTADGFGGGRTADDKLKIMKDSRVGTYGAVALVLILSLKWQLLVGLALRDPQNTAIVIIVSHGLSRVLAASLIFTENYVRQTDDAKSKPLANEQGRNELLILIATALLILSALNGVTAVVLLLTLITARFVIVIWFRGQIGGYTGDTLGAAQQVSEVVIYTGFILLGGQG